MKARCFTVAILVLFASLATARAQAANTPSIHAPADAPQIGIARQRAALQQGQG